MIFQETFFSYLLLIGQISFSSNFKAVHLLLEVSGNMCIVIACYSACDVINFEIYVSFLIKVLFYMIKNWKQKLKYLKNEKSF